MHAAGAARALSFVTMSSGLSDIMSLSEQVLILGVRADAKSVSCTGFEGLRQHQAKYGASHNAWGAHVAAHALCRPVAGHATAAHEGLLDVIP